MNILFGKCTKTIINDTWCQTFSLNAKLIYRKITKSYLVLPANLWSETLSNSEKLNSEGQKKTE